MYVLVLYVCYMCWYIISLYMTDWLTDSASIKLKLIRTWCVVKIPDVCLFNIFLVHVCRTIYLASHQKDVFPFVLFYYKCIHRQTRYCHQFVYIFLFSQIFFFLIFFFEYIFWRHIFCGLNCVPLLTPKVNEMKENNWNNFYTEQIEVKLLQSKKLFHAINICVEFSIFFYRILIWNCFIKPVFL